MPNETFEIFRSMYLYDRSGLDPRLEANDDSSPAWRKKKVTFRPAYGGELMAAYLFLSKSSQPPYQTVVFMPWASSKWATSGSTLVCLDWIECVIKSGRAVMYPVFQATYERTVPAIMATARPSSIIGARDLQVMRVKDLARSIDYLETPPDIRKDQLAFDGASMAAMFGPFLALEPRIKTAVLADGSFPPWRLMPAADAINFAPRLKIPVLMVNGRYEFIMPLEELQNPMFRSFGTPEKDKRHVLLDTTHYALEARGAAVREIQGWFDKYLGPVQ